jgi:hypothetical protein
MENIFGGLIEFESHKDFEIFMESVDRQTALKLIESALGYGLSNGLYSMGESYCLYKCINKLKENEDNIKTNNIRDDDNHRDSN